MLELQQKINNYLNTNTRKKRKLYFIKFENFFPEIQQAFISLKLSSDIPFSQKMWHIMHNTSTVPKCLSCNTPARWHAGYPPYGNYGEFCSIKCSSVSEIKHSRNIITCQQKYGVNNPFQYSKFKQKAQDTLISKYGVSNISKCEDIKIKKAQTTYNNYGRYHNLGLNSEQLMVSKYGVTNAAYLPNTNNMLNRFKVRHLVILPSGNQIYVHGYERFAIPYLLSIGYSELEILTAKRDMPIIKYIWHNKTPQYYPDIYIPTKNLIIEVKSPYTMGYDLSKNYAKFRACLTQNYAVWCLIFDHTGQVHESLYWSNIIELDHHQTLQQ